MGASKTTVKEVWEDIPKYEGYYQISNMGRIKSVSRTIVDKNGIARTYKDRILCPRWQNGYRMAVLSKENIAVPIFIHRIVAKVFLGEPEKSGLVVNHKNSIRSDNRVENLEWCTQGENIRHARAADRYPKNPRSKAIVCSNGCTYESITSAAKLLGIRRSNLQLVLRGKRKHVCGLSFWFAD